MILFVVLVFDPDHLAHQKLQITTNKFNLTIVDCKNPLGSKSIYGMNSLDIILNECCHHKILIGRPGIGKTILIKKILHQLITSGDEF